MKKHLATVAACLAFFGCDQIVEPTAGDEGSANETSGIQPGLEGEKVEPISDSAATNNLGIPHDSYDYQIVVRSESMNLLDEESEETLPPEGEEAAEKETTDEDEEEKKPEGVGKPEKEDKESDDEESDDEESMEVDEIKKCSKAFGIPAEGLKIAGSGNTVELEAADYVAVKITGNKNAANLLLTSDVEAPAEEGAGDTGESESAEVPHFKGICAVLAGNGAALNVVINNVIVDQVVIIARGNETGANFEVKEGAEIVALDADVKGNSNGVKIIGDGKYPEIPAEEAKGQDDDKEKDEMDEKEDDDSEDSEDDDKDEDDDEDEDSEEDEAEDSEED